MELEYGAVSSMAQGISLRLLRGLLISLQHGAEAGGDDGGGREEARENRGWSQAGMRMSKKGGWGGSQAYVQCGRRVVVGGGL